MTIQKYIHTSPRKLRLVADMVRKMDPTDALDVLRVTQKSAAQDLAKAIETVLANSKQKGMDIEKVLFKAIEINEGTKMRRIRASARGRTRPFKRRMAHIKIVLSDDLNLKAQNSNVKNKNPEEKNEKENNETAANTGQSVSEIKSKEGGRTGLSK